MFVHFFTVMSIAEKAQCGKRHAWCVCFHGCHKIEWNMFLEVKPPESVHCVRLCTCVIVCLSVIWKLLSTDFCLVYLRGWISVWEFGRHKLMMLCVYDMALGTLQRENKNWFWSSNIVAGDVHFWGWQ